MGFSRQTEISWRTIGKGFFKQEVKLGLTSRIHNLHIRKGSQDRNIIIAMVRTAKRGIIKRAPHAYNLHSNLLIAKVIFNLLKTTLHYKRGYTVHYGNHVMER